MYSSTDWLSNILFSRPWLLRGVGSRVRDHRSSGQDNAVDLLVKTLLVHSYSYSVGFWTNLFLITFNLICAICNLIEPFPSMVNLIFVTSVTISNSLSWNKINYMKNNFKCEKDEPGCPQRVPIWRVIFSLLNKALTPAPETFQRHCLLSGGQSVATRWTLSYEGPSQHPHLRGCAHDQHTQSRFHFQFSSAIEFASSLCSLLAQRTTCDHDNLGCSFS